MKIIVLELNEVPHKVQKKFSFTKLAGRYKSDYHKTISMDSGHLSPWITWATVHRGVNNSEHGINDINQCTNTIDEKYPTIFSKCIDNGLSVGLVNTMHSGRLAYQQNRKYTFLLPEAFASNKFCIPSSLEDFQTFNLLMSRGSSRSVSRSLPRKINFLKVLFSYLKNTNRLRGLRKAFNQIVIEIIKPYFKVRRRTIQSDLIFDLFFSLMKKNSPDLSVFFTNHVACNMHRFWEATFPEDYEKQVSSESWLERYKNEIPYAMQTANDYINSLKNYIDKKKDTQLWIMSSMGQEKVEGYIPQNYFWDIVDINAFVSSCLMREVKVESLPQMIPIYSFKSTPEIIDDFEKFLKNSLNIKLRARTSTTIAFTINNQDIIIKNKRGSLIPDGVLKKDLDENTSSAAYHNPEGFLLRYGPNLKGISEDCFSDKNQIRTDKIKSLIELTLNLN